jgi:nucleoside-diphosphate-sugar epimerase
LYANVEETVEVEIVPGPRQRGRGDRAAGGARATVEFTQIAKLVQPLERAQSGGLWWRLHCSIELVVGSGATVGVHSSFVVDDDPAPVREWLPALAAALGAKPPWRVPRRLARVVAGEAAVVLMTEIRGASNAKAKRELGWTLQYPSWRRGFVEAYAAADAHHVPALLV